MGPVSGMGIGACITSCTLLVLAPLFTCVTSSSRSGPVRGTVGASNFLCHDRDANVYAAESTRATFWYSAFPRGDRFPASEQCTPMRDGVVI